MEDKGLLTLHSQYCDSWWSLNAKSQSIRNQDIDIIISEYFGFNIKWFNIQSQSFRNSATVIQETGLNLIDTSLFSGQIFICMYFNTIIYIYADMASVAIFLWQCVYQCYSIMAMRFMARLHADSIILIKYEQSLTQQTTF